MDRDLCVAVRGTSTGLALVKRLGKGAFIGR